MAKKSTEVALTSTSSVSEGIELVRAKLNELKEIETTTWKTSGKVTMSNGTLKDLRDEKSIPELVKAYSAIKLRCEALDGAYDDLGISPAPVSKIDGGTIEEWRHDFQLRMKIIQQEETKAKLTKIESQWRELMDKEDKKALLIKEMQNL